MRYRVYGVTVESDHRFSVKLQPDGRTPDLRFELVADGAELDLTSAEPVYSEGLDQQGRPFFEYYDLGDRDLVRITAAMDFHCWPDRIACHLYEPKAAYLVDVAFFGMIMAFWLERRGTPTLHASAAVIGDRAVAFLARRGGGKTSTAAACVAAGHPLLTEDLLALRAHDGRVLGEPGYPQFRMWPQQARHFVGSEDHPTFRPDYDKRRVAIGDGFGTFADGPAPIARFYLPDRDQRSDASVDIQPVSRAEATMLLMQQSFLPGEVRRYGLQPARFAFFARVASSIPLCRIRVPNGLGELPRVVEAIEADLVTG